MKPLSLAQNLAARLPQASAILEIFSARLRPSVFMRRNILLSIASHSLSTIRETSLANMKLRIRCTTLIVKSRSFRSLCFKSLNHTPLRTALRFNLANASRVKGTCLVPLFDFLDGALNQIALLKIVSVPQFLRNRNPALTPHIHREGDSRFPAI